MIKLNLIRTIGNLEVWEVDGSEIRKTLEPEFTNFGQYIDFKCIPKNELWIDQQKVHDEKEFFITRMLVERKLIEFGLPLNEVNELAKKAERAERFKNLESKTLPNSTEEQLKIIKLKSIATVGDVDIWLVNGELVRDLYFEDYTEGGHDLVYSFIPPNNVWIDDTVEDKERSNIMLHELFERQLMTKGFSYNNAHKAATEIEWISRQGDTNEK